MPNLDWWVVKDGRDFIMGQVSKFSGMGVGWDRVLDLARDALEHPHLTVANDLLLLECREMSDLLLQIVTEDGHSLTLAECLRAIILDVAAHTPADAGQSA